VDKEYFLAHNGLGGLFFEQKRYDQAKEEFKRSLSLNPKDADAHNWRGRVAVVQKQYDDAERAFRDTIQLDEKWSPAHLNLGSLLILLERYVEAETHLQEAVKLDPRDDESHNELGRLFYTTGKYSEAVFQYRQAVRTNAKNVTAQRGLVLSLMAADRFDEAERQLRPLVESKGYSRIDTKNAWIVHQTLAELFTRLGQRRGDAMFYDEALAAVDKALSGAPGEYKAELNYKRGIINYYLKQYEVAERDFDRCVNLDKTHYSAKRNLERLRTSLSGRRSKTLQRLGITVGSLAIIQLIGLWILYLVGLKDGKEIVSPATFGVLAPLFFAFILVSL
ncbi:MAG: tetratricopeptide repeat protein, partial [Bacteroidota bacterium]